MPDNPYAPPLVPGVRAPRGGAEAAHMALRVVVHTQLALIFIVAFVSLVDTGILPRPELLAPVLFALAPFAVRAGFLCPVAMVFALAWTRPAWNTIALALLVETVLLFLLYLALLPMVL